MLFLTILTVLCLSAFSGLTVWFLHITAYSIKSWEVALPAIGAIIFSLFLFAKFLLEKRKKIKTNFRTIDGIEILLPAFGAMLFTIFLGAKSLTTIKEEKKTTFGYVNSILDNTGDIITYPSHFDSLNPSIREHTFYVDYGFMGIYLKNYLLSKYDSQDILDTVEFVFLNKLLNGWVIPNPSKVCQKVITSDELQEMASENRLFKITNDDVKAANARIGFQQKLYTFKDEFLYTDGNKLKSVMLPENTNLAYLRDANRRIVSFENKVVKFDFTIFDGGINNFRPEHNAFHQYLARLANAGIPRHSDYLKMKKTIIIFNYEFKKYASLRDDYEDYQSLMREIEENLNNQFFWEPLKKVLENEYLLAK